MTRIHRVQLSLLAAATILGCSSDPRSSGEPQAIVSEWQHYESDFTEDGHVAHREQFIRGNEAINLYYHEGRLLFDERCEGKRYTSRQVWPTQGGPDYTNKIVQDLASPEECFTRATHEAFRFIRTPEYFADHKREV